MSNTELETQLLEWFQTPEVQAKRWNVRIFWELDVSGKAERLRFEPCEVEVLFTTILGIASQCKEKLDSEQNGRGTFIANNIKRHELPMLTRRD